MSENDRIQSAGTEDAPDRHGKTRRRIIIAAAVALAAASAFAVRGISARSTDDAILEDNRFLLDTVVSIRLYSSRNEATLEEAFDLIAADEAAFSRHIEGSDVSRINAAEAGRAVEVSSETAGLIAIALDYAARSGGAFDPTVGPLVDLWDIGGADPSVPEKSAIDAVLPLVDYREVEIDEASSMVRMNRDGMALDLGGIAKGRIADRTVEYLINAGEQHILVNLGGNILVHGGKPDGRAFRIGMQDPFDDRGSYLGVFTMESGSVVSSGVYERYFDVDDVRYHHILDTGGGYPVDNGLAGVTILSERSVDGDALSTTLFSLGLEAAADFLADTDGIEAAFVTTDGRILLTEGAAARFEPAENAGPVELIGIGE